MRIVTVGYLTGSGGAEKQIILLSNHLAEREHNVTLCVLAKNISPFPISEKVRVVDLSGEEGQGRLRILKRFFIFRKAVQQISPDIIICYNLQSAFFSLFVNKEKRGKVVYSERGDPYDKEYSGLLGSIRDYTINRMDGLVFQSEGALNCFPEEVRKKSIVIHNSVNVPNEKYPIPSFREKRIVSVGRLHPQKNQKLLIDAFSRVSTKFPDFSLEIYGDGMLAGDLQSHINSLNLNGKVHLCPSRKNIFDYIYKASLFVLSSDYEGMPNALMEAMALGIPCISTDCRPGGARTLIKDGINGVIVPCKDVDSLSMAMEKVLSDKYYADSLGHNAIQIGETHTEKMIFDKWNDYLFNITGSDYYSLHKQKLLSLFRLTVDFLNNNKLTWWAAYGTAIGAVRHHNIIPWDDDVDICMPRSDFEKLIKMRNRLKGSGFRLMTMGDDDLFTVESKIVLDDSSRQEKAFLHCNTGVFIDIFPLDLVDEDYDTIKLLQHESIKSNRKFYFSLVRPSFLLILDAIMHLRYKNIYVLICGILYPYRKRFKYLNEYKDFVEKIKSKAGGDYFVSFAGPYKEKEIFKKEWFLESVDIPFDDFEVKLPSRYDDWIKRIYGNYMQLPPENKRKSHHGEFYMNLSKRLTHKEIMSKVKNNITHEV